METFQKYFNTMQIQKPKLVTLGFFFFLLGAANSFADFSVDTSKLAGQWKMSDKPIWVEMSFIEGVGQGQIIRHENDPLAVGKLLLSNIVKDSDKNFWNGFIYVPQLSRIHPMKLSHIDSQEINIRVKVGFIKKTVILNRVND